MKNQQKTSPNQSSHELSRFERSVQQTVAQIKAEALRLWKYLKKHGPFWLRQLRQDVRRESQQTVQAIKRVGQERVYRLKGYTTVAKINRKRQSERQQRFLRRVLLVLFGFLLAILLANVYNPIKDFSEWYQIIGVRHLTDTAPTTTASIITETQN